MAKFHFPHPVSVYQHQQHSTHFTRFKMKQKNLFLEINLKSKIFYRSLTTLFLLFVLSDFLWSDTNMPKENYQKTFLFDLKVDKSQVDDVFVDANENFYVIHSKNPIIEIFNKTGSSVREIGWKNTFPDVRFKINVDEDGNILILGSNQLNIPGIILDKDGNLIANFNLTGLQNYSFSNGNVYQVTDGKVLYSLPSTKTIPRQKLYFKDFDESFDKARMAELVKNHIYNPNHNLHLPKKIGEFLYWQFWAITNDGTSFAFYATRPVVKPGYTFQNPYQIRELIKFDPNYKTEGVIPTTGWPLVNLETGNLYEETPGDGIVKIYRWDKIN